MNLESAKIAASPQWALARGNHKGFYYTPLTPLYQAWPRVGRAQKGGLSSVGPTYCFKYASLPRGSTRPSCLAFRRFGHEPS